MPEQKRYVSLPDCRRGRLKQALAEKSLITALEAHSGLTGLIAEKTSVSRNGQTAQFDAIWCSSLCDSTLRGKPDIELVDLSDRLRTLDEIMDVTTKPIIFDGDTGGLSEHFVYHLRTLERMGVSAVIIEDKTGLKKNSLFGTDVEQTQDTIENFCTKISAGKAALQTEDFLLIARIESLILEQGMEDALKRAFAYVAAGADGIMIHSKKKDPAEIFEFCEKFRSSNVTTPLVVVPSTVAAVTEQEFADRGVNLVIYANQLTRSAVLAMQKTAEMILSSQRALEADSLCMPIQEILRLIPQSN
ncbi:MAG TPA: phosphoenolpyruvate mutase [Bacillota bacterium]|nr:phosphoenolpyruvate mutase [Bacillota bacterium]